MPFVANDAAQGRGTGLFLFSLFSGVCFLVLACD